MTQHHHTGSTEDLRTIINLQRRVHRWRLVGIGALAVLGGALIAGAGSAASINTSSAQPSVGGDVVSFNAGSRVWVAGPEGTRFWRIDGLSLNRVD